MSSRRPTGTVQYDYSGCVVVVTGGCGGIGHAIVSAFATCGATVVALDVDQHGVELQPRTHYLQVDVSQEPQCATAIETVVSRFGGLDILVNSAAIQPPASYAPMHEMPAELWNRMLAVNLSGYAFMAKHTLRHMLPQRSGTIVNIGSAQAHRTARQVAAYGPTKAGNLMQSMQWGVEYAREGIRVVSVSPGAIETPLLMASLEQQGGSAALANRHPLGRLGKPEEVAHAVLWLASADAAFITATDLAVDGGLGAFAAFADPYPLT